MDVIVKVRDPEENLEEKIKAYKVKIADIYKLTDSAKL